MNIPISPEATETEARKRDRAFIVFAILAHLLIFLLHVSKGWGLGPIIMPDEQIYSFDIRLKGFPETHYPNYIYYGIYRIIDMAGDRFLDAARILNSLFFVLAGPFIYGIARMICDRRLSLFVAVLFLLSPISAYTLHLTPEPLYIFIFWLWTWLLLRKENSGRPAEWIACGAILGVLSFVKVNAALLLPGLYLHIAFSRPRRDGGGAALSRPLAIVVSTLAFAAAKCAIGYAFAGTGGVTLFGNTYGNFLHSGVARTDCLDFALVMLHNLLGHLKATAILFGAPLALAVFAAAFPSKEMESPLRRVSLFTLAVFFTLMAAAAAFNTLAVFAEGTLHSPEIGRLQTRYYNFLDPAFLVLAGFGYSLLSRNGALRSKNAVFLIIPVLAFALYGAVGLGGYELSQVFDCPEIGSFFSYAGEAGNGTPVPVLFVLALLPCCVYLFNRRYALAFFLFAFLPVYTAASWFMKQSPRIEKARAESSSDETARNIKKYLGEEAADTVIAADDNNFAGSSILFHLDDTRTGLLRVPKESGRVSAGDIRPGAKWLLVFGRVAVPDELKRYVFDFVVNARAPGFKFQLIRIAKYAFSIDFSNPRLDWPAGSVEEEPEATTVSYAIKLPDRFRLRLELAPEFARLEPDLEILVRGIAQPLRIAGTASASVEVEIAGDRIENAIQVRYPAPENAPWPPLERKLLRLEALPVR